MSSSGLNIVHQGCLALGQNAWDFLPIRLSHWIQAATGKVASDKEALLKPTLKEWAVEVSLKGTCLHISHLPLRSWDSEEQYTAKIF